MCDIHTMSAVETMAELGERIRYARVARELSQADLARSLDVDRSALVRMESGERKVSALELFLLAEVLKVPMSHFTQRSPAAMTSRRSPPMDDPGVVDRRSCGTDLALEAHFRDAEFLRENGLLMPVEAISTGSVPDFDAARRLAREAREFVGIPTGPLPGLAGVAERFGLYLLATGIPCDGASLSPDAGFGVSIVSSDEPPGRRRFTAAHEIGHHILGDEYRVDAGASASRGEREALVDSFASELLLPRADAARVRGAVDGTLWERLVRLAADYRVSWATALRTAADAGSVSWEEVETLRRRTPHKGDFVAVLGDAPLEDLTADTTGPRWRRAVLQAYQRSLVTAERAVEMLHGQLDTDELPAPEA